jgi:glutaminyl-peptide cyclotransferase
MIGRPLWAPITALAPCLLLGVGCNHADARSGPATPPAPPIAAQPAPAPLVDRPTFDADKAFKILLKQCEFGPRPVGTEAHDKTRDYMLTEMQKYADKAVGQDFHYRGMVLTNVIGVFNPDAPRQVLLSAHWDTRPRADMELDPDKKRKPILGANDGASGVAVLLELARNFKEKKPEVGVVIVLFDGEDYGDFDRDEGVFLGSRHFARNHKGYKPEFGINIDMIGDKDLNVYREINSQNYAPGTNNKVFSIAKELGYRNSVIDKLQTNVTDDHIPLNQAGIPTIDLIDFDYGPWHTLDDTPDKCSAKSLGIIGNLLAEVVYREKAR